MGDRVRVALACEKCGARNYHTTKAPGKGASSERLILKKYCPACGKHTKHLESK